MQRLLLLIALAALYPAAPANAKTYTPTELQALVRAGRYPEQGDVTKTVVDRSYAACIIALESMVDAIHLNYPTATIASTSLLRTEKVWTNDAALTVTCDAVRNKIIITRSPYL